MRLVGLCCSLLLLLPAVAGCQKSDTDVAPVTGKVTLDGAPLKGATVTFTPAKGSFSVAETDDTGAYKLMFTFDQPGAMLGEHTVRISKKEATTGPKGPGEKEILPAKYNAKSELKATVVDGKNNFDFPLSSGG